MMRLKLLTILIVSSFLSMGCLPRTSVGPVYDLDKPLLLGKPYKIGGTILEPRGKRSDFNFFNKTFKYSFGVYPGVRITSPKWQIDEGFTGAALKQLMIKPNDLIKIDAINYSAHYTWFTVIAFIYTYHECSTGVQGAIYKNMDPDGHLDIIHGVNGEKP